MIVQVPLFAANLKDGTTVETVHAALMQHYAGQDIVKVVPLEESKSIARIDAEELANQDIMKLHVFGNAEHINLVAVLDNLGKGASGAAVQNMELMLSA
jgi:N-acetyl-gamma-glutamyl-phosphate reductase